MRWTTLSARSAMAMLLVLVGCSTSDGGGDSNQGTDAADSGPIMFVVSAHDVDERGVALDPALEFAADDRQISIVALVGDVVSGSTLKVAWTWLNGPEGEQLLFEHEIDVAGGDVAYSTGLADGLLAAGHYRASVSLGESTSDALFAVRPTAIAFPDLGVGNSRPVPAKEGAPPSSGPSGTIPAPSESAPSAVCQPWVQVTSLLAMTGANGCGENLLEVTAWVGSHDPFGLGQSRGDFIKPVRADPCQLDGSDLEREPISYAVTVISGPDEDKLFRKQGPAPDEDTDAPMAFISSEPGPGAQVSAGDVIAVEITADDRTSVDAIVTGIASVRLATESGAEIDGWEFEGPIACDKDRLRRVVNLEYQVPENPPELIKLVATVTDYLGHETKVEATYPTVGLWTGYMDVAGGYTTVTPDGTFVCSTTWEFRVVLFAPSSGELYGYAEGIPEPQVCNYAEAAEGQFTRLGITGTITPDQLTLRFEHQSGGWNGISLLYLAPAAELTLTRSSNLAYSEISLSQVLGIITENLTGRIDLGCDDC